MRTYTRNSPEAAARIVALVLISDGHVSGSELDALARSDVSGELGLAPGALQPILHALCEDLACCAANGGASLDCLDDTVLKSIFAEVMDADLQRKVLALAIVASSADDHVADGESRLLELLRTQWFEGHELSVNRVGAALV